ncbi:hypothetical protein PBRA_000304 [Plasmodiophora brassicae]|uniref:F-box domain-containing protein n=1 Tax=Plasmodiophora brassicae TaxID=37360 RepID=A0A0G4IH58_PLABS|nr:hypothetical protein PBRA_000304 [Plasmodiophora brassicae]
MTQFLPGLPAEAQSRVVSLLPDRARVRASSVSKGWRAVLKPWLYRSVLVKLPNIASDDDAVQWIRMLERMSDHDTYLVAAAFHALQPCPKFDHILAVLKALAQPCIHVKRSKDIIQILHCIGIPSACLLTVRDRHGRTAVDVALGKGDLGRHHKVVLFDLHHHMALDHADLRFLEMLPTPDGQLHPYSANGLPAAHQAYDIARTRGLGIDALLGYLSRNPSWTVALDASGNTILHAVCSHGSPSDIDAVSRFMAQTAPREFEALLTVANAAGQRVDDLLRRRMRIPASRTFMSLLDDWSTTV